MSTKRTHKPVSSRKLTANRANARKSTGPKTPQGKAASSQNALKHRLLAGHAVMPDDPAEDHAEFADLLNQLTAEHAPAGPTERLFVERIAI